MDIQVNKKFLKELSLLPKSERLRIEKFIFGDLPGFSSPHKIPNLSRLKGYNHYFKIRFGDCRVGLQIINNTLKIERVFHRKDNYNYYP